MPIGYGTRFMIQDLLHVHIYVLGGILYRKEVRLCFTGDRKEEVIMFWGIKEKLEQSNEIVFLEWGSSHRTGLT